jgi:hypothetical protein
MDQGVVQFFDLHVCFYFDIFCFYAVFMVLYVVRIWSLGVIQIQAVRYLCVSLIFMFVSLMTSYLCLIITFLVGYAYSLSYC